MAAMVKHKPRRLVVFWLFRIVAALLYVLPIRFGLKAGQAIGRLVFYGLKSEREITLSNLNLAFGDTKSQKEKKVIARQVFENLGKNFVEIVSLSKFNRANIDRYIKCRGLEIIEGLISKGKGGIVLSAHFGNWELMAHYFAIKGYSVNVIARRVRLEHFERFLDRIREHNRVKILYRDASAKDVIALLKKNEFIGIMPDQDMDSVSGVFVDFFGRKAYTPDGPSVLNLLTGAFIIPCFIVRKRFGHEVVIEGPLELAAGGDREKDILENTRRCSMAIEGYIKRFPSQWVWFHRRWKTLPVSEQKVSEK